MNPSNIHFAPLPTVGKAELLPGEIDGLTVYAYALSPNDCATSEMSPGSSKVFIIIDGATTIGDTYCPCRGILTFPGGEEKRLTSTGGAKILEIRVSANSTMCKNSDFLPYDSAPKYKEDCKSEKTVSRMLLSDGILGSLAIGSVETYGEDKVEAHEHPFCDQLFFSFPENDMHITIDGEPFPLKGNVLVHIPLASSHGVIVQKGGCAHYLWIDFIIGKEGSDYMSSAHEFV